MDASQYGGWKRKENEERRQAQLSDINKKWKERKQNGYWGIVILNQNNKDVHSQTASNRDIQEPKSRTSRADGMAVLSDADTRTQLQKPVFINAAM